MLLVFVYSSPSIDSRSSSTPPSHSHGISAPPPASPTTVVATAGPATRCIDDLRSDTSSLQGRNRSEGDSPEHRLQGTRRPLQGHQLRRSSFEQGRLICLECCVERRWPHWRSDQLGARWALSCASHCVKSANRTEGLIPHVVYYGKVAGELGRIIYTGRGMQPP